MRGLLIASATGTSPDALERSFELDPRVAIRPESFGALAYHYGNRRLVFLRHPDIVRVVEQLAAHESLRATLGACGIDERRWPSFVAALTDLERSEIIRGR